MDSAGGVDKVAGLGSAAWTPRFVQDVMSDITRCAMGDRVSSGDKGKGAGALAMCVTVVLRKHVM